MTGSWMPESSRVIGNGARCDVQWLQKTFGNRVDMERTAPVDMLVFCSNILLDKVTQ